MKVFLSYGTAADQVTALRLQALGAVNGLTVYVPPAHTRRAPTLGIDPESALKLGEADFVLGLVASGLSEACRQELNASLSSLTPMAVLADISVAMELGPYFGTNLIVIDPARPDHTELEIVEHLRAIDAKEKSKNALIALGTLALGLLIFAPQD